mgnify:CR=1 FL=1
MATQSPFSMLEGLFQNLPAALTPPAWAIEESHRRVVLLLNHVLQQEPQAIERLARQKGRVIHTQWREFTFRVQATPAGLLDLAGADAKPDLTLTITEDSPFAIAQAVMQGGKPSVTHYSTLEAFPAATLVEVILETGRTHQIRVHFSAFRHPLVGDTMYGADPKLAARVGLDRQWLHAVRLSFEHPTSGEQVEYTSEYPADLEHALAVLRGQ